MADRGRQAGQDISLDVEEAARARRACLLVLGMHRGGTSALTGLLARLGAKLPKRLQPGDAANPRGYGESRAIVQFNDRLLASAGSSWDDFRSLNLESSKLDSAAAELRELVNSEFGNDAPLFVLKDPRISRAAKFWLDQLDASKVRPRVILILRNPLDVAASLNRRDSLSLSASLLLWLRHMLDAEADTRGQVRSFVLYEELLTNWRTLVERLERDLGLRWPNQPDAIEDDIGNFLSRELHHHAAPEGQLLARKDVLDWVRTVYPLLGAMAQGEQCSSDTFKTLDAIRGEFDVACHNLGWLVGEAKSSRDAALARKTELDTRISEFSREIEELRYAHSVELHRLRVEIDSLKASISGRLTRALRRLTGSSPALSKAFRETAILSWWVVTLQADQLSKYFGMYREAYKLRASGLFDQAWYLAKNPDVAASGSDPILHYLRFGAAEGRNPSPSFDTRVYLATHPDVAQAGVNPLSHYIQHEASQGQLAGPPGDAPRVRVEGGIGSRSNPFATVYYERWNQTCGTGHADVYGALSARPAKSERCPVKLIAYYLPQFHPIPENDAWWGRGFTEWRNVAKAAPAFVDHYQPKLPGELGFYDLRVVEVLRRQVELARHYGISAFCFHFYWFGDKRLLETPLLAFLKNKDLDLSFCLCWANENWTRTWDGAHDQVLIGQKHSPEDDVAFIRYLKKYFDDPRYLKIDGKPVLTVYRPGILPDARASCKRWRAEAVAMGFPGLYLVATNSFRFWDYEAMGFDALSEFPPHDLHVSSIRHKVQLLKHDHTGGIFSYAEVVESQISDRIDARKVLPGVMTGWDNCARRPTHGHVFHGSTPWLFNRWLTNAVERARRNPPSERFVVINAWNEWAEGAYLEPDARFGYAYLAACASAVTDNGSPDERVTAFLAEQRAQFKPRLPRAVALHLFYEDMAKDFADRIRSFGDLDLYITVANDISIDVARKVAEIFPEAYILEVPNRGRDMLPFMTIYDILREGGHEFVCKLHTKRSSHLQDGKAWRDELVASLLSTEAEELLSEGGPRLGLLASKGSLASLQDEFVRRHSEDRIRSFALKLGADVTFDESFVAGSMFWFRPQALDQFTRLAAPGDFEPELGQIDATLAHALERMTVIAVNAAGFETAEIGDVGLRRRQY